MRYLNIRNGQFTFIDKVLGSTIESRIRLAGNPITPDTFKDIVWARAVHDVEIDEGKGLVGFMRTPQREGRFKWVGPIGKVSLGFWAKKRRPIKFNISQELHIYKVGVVRDSAPEHILVNRFNFTTDKLERLRSEGPLVRMLAVGRLDLVVLNDALALKIIRSQGLNPDEYEKVCTLIKDDFYLALNKDTGDELVTRLQEALDNLKTKKTGQTTSTFQKIYDSYN